MWGCGLRTQSYKLVNCISRIGYRTIRRRPTNPGHLRSVAILSHEMLFEQGFSLLGSGYD
jgi:hypothetical protein